MLREQSRILLAIHQAIDLGIIIVCSFFAYYTKLNLPEPYGGLSDSHDYLILLLLTLISFHISLRLFGVYGNYRRMTYRQVFKRVIQGTMTGTAGVVFITYLLHFESLSRLLIGLLTFYAFIGLICFKTLLYRLLARTRSKNYNTRSILVIGSRQRALDFIKAIRRRKESGYRIRGCLETNDQSELVGERIYRSIKVIGTLDRFKELLKNETIDEIVFGIPLKKIDNVHEYIYFAEQMGKNVRVLPDFQINKIQYYPQTAAVEIEDFLGVTTLALSSTPKDANELLLKAALDYTGAAIGVVLISPLLLFISLLIKFSSRGPVLFSQERAGLNGRKFRVHKFRTMVVNAEKLRDELLEENEMDGPVFKIKKDPRITWIGGILRKTSLDELPQLFNVLKGEMSLVGPRPPLPSEVEEYKLWQRRRLSMKPGMTCIWQVSGRNDISFEQWMNMDLEYIDNWSFGLDLKLLVLTVREVTIGGGR